MTALLDLLSSCSPPAAKPSPPKQLAFSMAAPEELHVGWSPPGGDTPPQCLEYEIQLAEDRGKAKAAWTVGTALRAMGRAAMREPCLTAGGAEAHRKTGADSGCRRHRSSARACRDVTWAGGGKH